MALCLPLTLLPSEIQLHVYMHCSKEELKTLCQCSKYLHDQVLPLLWGKMKISWRTLEKNTSMLDKCHLKNNRLISRLKLHGSVDKKGRGYRSFKFGLFLLYCDPQQLKSLSVNDFIAPDGLRIVSEIIPNLHCLTLVEVDADWDFLSHFTGLTSLRLNSCKIGKSHWKDVCQMESLRTLQFSLNHLLSGDDYFTEMDFKLKNLRHLDLSYTSVGNDMMSLVSGNCRHLESLNVSYTNISDLGLSCISHLLSLKHLNLEECEKITDNGMFFISRLPMLEHLNINYSGASFACLQNISQLKTLTHLNIRILPDDSDENFSHVQELTRLRTLGLYGAHGLTDASLQVISELVFLEKLEISDCDEFTDDGLVHLTKLPLLRALVCDGNERSKITDDGLDSHGLSELLVNEL